MRQKISKHVIDMFYDVTEDIMRPMRDVIFDGMDVPIYNMAYESIFIPVDIELDDAVTRYLQDHETEYQ